MKYAKKTQVQPIPVEELSSRRSELLEKPQLDVEEAGELRISLLNAPSTQSCALLTILVPSIKNIQHDQPYALPYKDDGLVLLSLADEGSSSASSDCLIEDMQLSRMQAMAHKFYWHRERRCPITGSKCRSRKKEQRHC